MALKKKSLHRLSSIFSPSDNDQRPVPLPSNIPGQVQKRSPRPRPVSQQLLQKPADGSRKVDHQRAVSTQLQPPPVNHGPRKVASNELLTASRPPTTTSLKPSPSTPNLAPNTSASRSPYLHPSGSTPNLLVSPANSRPTTPDSAGEHLEQKTKHRSGLFSGNKLKKKKEVCKGPIAWTAGRPDLPYEPAELIAGQIDKELWNDNGDTFVYLFPYSSGRGPSFKIESALFSSSATLTKIAFGNIYSMPTAMQGNAAVAQDVNRRQISFGTPPPSSTNSYTEGSDGSRDSRALDPVEQGQPVHLYVPVKLSDAAVTSSDIDPHSLPIDDIESLISARNLFAFLLGGRLIATERRPTFFEVFLEISEALQHFQFSNLDGSTFGEIAHSSFNEYVNELKLNDVRTNPETNIEAIVLGERMRSVSLYNEAFVHGVGRLDIIKSLGSPKWQMISPITENRMERAAIDLELRKRETNAKIEDFQFYGLFQGIMISNTAEESKVVNFGKWRSSYDSTRKWLMSYYKNLYGSWPPKPDPKGKKNKLHTPGLNRAVLNQLYSDLSKLYDMLVDRHSLTTRSSDLTEDIYDTGDTMPRALRKVLSEYDRSTPPVLPPIPFDTPLMPKIRDANNLSKRLKKEELNRVLQASYNSDANINDPFLDSFRHFDYQSAHNQTIAHIADVRYGQWIFIYAVLQALPMLVVDALALKYTQDVEYFLCQAPRLGVPWAREDLTAKRNWYGVAGSDKIVSLPSDLISYGTEGTYRRSHCWVMAEKWTASSTLLATAVAETLQPPLPQPPGSGFLTANPNLSRPGSPESPGRRSNRHSIVELGLEALPLPGGVSPDMASSSGLGVSQRPVSEHWSDPSRTFDQILGEQQTGKKKK